MGRRLDAEPFRLDTDDARIVEKEMGVFTAEEILSLDVGQAIARAGRPDQSFNIETYPEPPLEGDGSDFVDHGDDAGSL